MTKVVCSKSVGSTLTQLVEGHNYDQVVGLITIGSNELS